METSLFITLHVRDGHESGLDELIAALQHGRRNIIALPRPYDLMSRLALRPAASPTSPERAS